MWQLWFSILLLLLLQAAADPSRTNQFGETPLHVAAAASGQAPCAACALTTGPDEGGSGHGDGEGDGSERHGDAHAVLVVRALLRAGAPASGTDAAGNTPLESARQHLGAAVPAAVAEALGLAMVAQLS